MHQVLPFIVHTHPSLANKQPKLNSYSKPPVLKNHEAVY